MILRNVIVAAERERLRAQHAPEQAPAPPLPERPRPRLEVLVEPPARPPLDAQTVCDWLEAQSAQVRTLCASRLASDLEALRAEALAAGRELGRTQARAEALASVESSLAALAQMAGGCEQAFARECAQLAESCAEIVAEAFCKIAGPALATREAALAMVLQVVTRAKDERALTIRVSAQDLPFLEAEGAAIQKALGTRSWTLCADPRVALGGCLVESSLGTLDGRLELQLKELWETLRAAMASRRQDP